MNLRLITNLSLSFKHSRLTGLEYVMGGTRIRMTGRGLGRGPSRDAADSRKSEAEAIRAPCVGIFRAAHPTSPERFVPEGSPVKRGQVVGFLQVGPWLRPVIAPSDGVIGPRLAAEGARVGFHTALLVFEKK